MQRKPIRKVSAKKRAQLKEERLLTARLIIKQNGLCPCGRKLGFGSAKHEKIFRSHGGDPTDENNTVLLCLECHGKRHGLNLKLTEK